MRWIEIITLRTTEKMGRELTRNLLAETLKADSSTFTSEHLLEITIYDHAVLETDLSIHIYWESEKEIQFKSPLAIRIYAALLGMGLLDYSIWIERTVRDFSLQSRKKTREYSQTFSTKQ
jgi:hypothetical protein